MKKRRIAITVVPAITVVVIAWSVTRHDTDPPPVIPRASPEPVSEVAGAGIRPGNPAGIPTPRRAVDASNLAGTVSEFKRLLTTSDPPPNAAGRIREYTDGLSEQLRVMSETLEFYGSATQQDPQRRLAEKKVLAVYLGIERKLDGLLRGDYCFGTYERLDHPRFEVFAWPDNEYRGAPDLLLALDRNEPPLYRQLLIEIDHEVKVTAFNEMSERMRRRVLELREESLREDSPEDQRWLATYFPETFTIDEATATIR